MSKNVQNGNVLRKITYEKIITYIFLAVLLVTLIINVIFQGGSKIARIVLTIGTVIACWAFFRFTFLKRSKASYIAALIFILMAMYFGNILNFYDLVPYYDKILHTSSGIIIGIMSIVVYAHFTKEYFHKVNPRFIMLFCVIFAIALAGGWEIWEYTTDKLFGLDSQLGSLDDTMTDIICGTIGGIIALIPIYRFSKGHENRFLNAIIKEVI
ncbi:MAG: hypothetical protein Q4F66_00285 [Clostridium sp.]|nr:hypothetical protein [Clostridium sp.]